MRPLTHYPRYRRCTPPRRRRRPPLCPQVPVPPNTARCLIHVGSGRAKYEPEQRAIVWRIKRMIGGAEAVFTADVELTPSIRGKAWSRPPIQVGVLEGPWKNRRTEGMGSCRKMLIGMGGEENIDWLAYQKADPNACCLTSACLCPRTAFARN